MGIMRFEASSSSAAERLGERADLVVPAPGHDRVGDLVAGRLPPVDPVERVQAVGERDRPVERHPAHQLGVQEVAGLAPHLPDALVLLLPAGGGGVGQVGEEPAA